MKKSYLDYAMSVIIGLICPTCATARSPSTGEFSMACTGWASPRRSLTASARRSSAKCSENSIRTAIRPFTTRSCAWRRISTYCAIRSSTARKLRLRRRRSAGGDAVHRGAAFKNRGRNARGHRERNRRLRTELRRKRAGTDRPANQNSEPARQWPRPASQ